MSFLEGFAGSLGNYFSNKAVEEDRTKRDTEEWEKRQQRLMALQAQADKSRAVQITQFKQGKDVMSQAVNALGEPVGAPRLASQWEMAAFNKFGEDAELEKRERKAKLTSTENAATVSNKQLDTFDTDYARNTASEEKEAARRAATTRASVGASEASARSSDALTTVRNLETEFLKKNGGEGPPRDTTKEVEAFLEAKGEYEVPASVRIQLLQATEREPSPAARLQAMEEVLAKIKATRLRDDIPAPKKTTEYGGGFSGFLNGLRAEDAQLESPVR